MVKDHIKDNGAYGFSFYLCISPAGSKNAACEPYKKNKQTAKAVGGGLR